MLERQIVRIAGAQHGLVHRQQLTHLGLSPHQVRNRVRTGALEWRSPVVLGIPGSPRTGDQRRMLAVLDAGRDAALSHRTAARVWGLDARSSGLHVVRTRDEIVRVDYVATVHQARELLPEHITRVDGIPVTTPSRMILDIAATESYRRTERLFDRAWGHRLVTLGSVWSVLQQVRGRGRRGVAHVEQMIADRRGMKAPESGLEVRFEEILRKHGFALPERQVDLFDDDGWFSRADFCQREQQWVLYVDSDTYHRSLTDRAYDDLQTRRARAAGYGVGRVSDAEILYDERAVVAKVRRLITPVSSGGTTSLDPAM